MPSRRSPDGGVDFGHTLVILEDGAEATLLTEIGQPASGRRDGLHCGAIEVIHRPGLAAAVRQPAGLGHSVWHFAHQKAVVGRDASLQWTIGALGSRLAKVNQHVALVGAGAECQVNGVMFTEGKQHLSYHTLQHHEAPHCRSDFLYKAALQDKSRTVWRGMIKVDPPGSEDRRLSAKRQPAALRPGPGRFDPGTGDRSRRRALHARVDHRPRGRRADLLRSVAAASRGKKRSG